MQPAKRLTVSCVLFVVCHQVDAELSAALASVSELIFFVLGAMTIVEVRHLRCWCVWGELCLPPSTGVATAVASNLHPACWLCADIRCACVVLCGAVLLPCRRLTHMGASTGWLHGSEQTSGKP